jgi:hypothetical protein
LIVHRPHLLRSSRWHGRHSPLARSGPSSLANWYPKTGYPRTPYYQHCQAPGVL